MAMDRWDPFRDLMTLRDSMERIFQDNFVRVGGALSAFGSMPIDVMETDDGFKVRASVPGVRPEDVEVQAQGNVLTIRANQAGEEESSGQNWIVRERRAGTLQRSITLPAMVDAERAEARIEHGVLTLRLPRADAARPRQIKVGAAGGPGVAGEVARPGAA